MSDIELTNEEQEILSEVLSVKSQDENGGFFHNRDEIHNLIESKYSDVIEPERINTICNELISPLYEGGVSPKYENVKSYMEEYQVFMEDADPVTLNAEAPYTEPNSSGSNKKEPSEANKKDTPESPLEKNTDKAHTDAQNKSTPKDRVKKEREKDRDEPSVQERTREVEQRNAELDREAQRMRQFNMYHNPNSVMGHMLAKFGIITNRAVSNIMSSRIPFIPNSLVEKFPVLGQTLSGKSFFGKSVGYNMKDVRSKRMWEDGSNNDRGNSLLRKSEDIKNLLVLGKHGTAVYEMGQLDESIKKRDYKLDKESRKKLQENIKSFAPFLEPGKDDSKDKKAAKKQMEKLSKKINQFLTKLFGGKMAHKAENDGPQI